MTWAAWAMLIPAWTIVILTMTWSMNRVLRSSSGSSEMKSADSESTQGAPSEASVPNQGSYRALTSDMQGAPE
ncbi:hypothetical protein Plim_0411 [Planctopirus limnophila DSM 3776]|uniref:Uncharacterized protein n=1 Tax=Planctopirus limnophila (strain ATCC 43296 / DSM 3776 / IFAM 1008 / Mu 290) TaxID=521674 RepID=D5SPN1_PLAL2|nr:hypothetical protein [Planctopirus limnophila]ADG66261.1 hypothetical protein Plim_0411 [Planctopirus limnophila DSM 3776]